MDEVLQHGALDTGLLVLPEPFDDLVGRAVDHRGRVAAGQRAPLAESPLRLRLVAADDAARHHREAERLATGGPRRFVDGPAPLARVVDGRKDGVVLVGVCDCGTYRPWPR